MVKKLTVCLICFMGILSFVYAAEKAVTVDLSHPVAEHESKNDARRICFLNAKKQLISDTADFFHKHKTGEIAMLEKVDMEQYLSVLLKIETTFEKWEFTDNRLVLHMVAESLLDPDILEKQMLALHKDQKLKSRIKKDQERLKTLENEYIALEKQLVSAKDEAAVALRKESQVISSEMDRIETVQYAISSMTKMVSEKIATGMTIDELITIAGQPKTTATCEKPDFLNYGNIWVWVNNGVVIGKIPMEKWAGPCYRYSFADRGADKTKDISATGMEKNSEKPKFIINLKTGQIINTSTYYNVNDVIYYKKYGGIIGIEEDKVDSSQEIE